MPNRICNRCESPAVVLVGREFLCRSCGYRESTEIPTASDEAAFEAAERERRKYAQMYQDHLARTGGG